jgi:mRNA interferase RelE/StbE
MNWKLVFEAKARRALKQLTPKTRERILKVLTDRIAKSQDPRSTGEALTGPYADYWKYRVGDYRIITKIEDQTITIYVIAIGHRSGIYK